MSDNVRFGLFVVIIICVISFVMFPVIVQEPDRKQETLIKSTQPIADWESIARCLPEKLTSNLKWDNDNKTWHVLPKNKRLYIDTVIHMLGEPIESKRIICKWHDEVRIVYIYKNMAFITTSLSLEPEKIVLIIGKEFNHVHSFRQW